MSEEEDIPLTYKPGTLSSQSEASVDKADTEEYSENLLGRNFIERATELAKGRRYVEDPSDAPEDVEVQEGPQGGHYYETGSSGDESGSNDTPNTDDGETLWQAELATNYSEGDDILVDTERVGEIEGHIPEGGLDFLEYDELILVDNDGQEHTIPTGDIQGIEPQGGNDGGEAVEPDQSSDEFGDKDIPGMSDEELQEYADYLWSQHESYQEARGGQGGRSTDTQMDEGMKDTLETLREIDEELRSREGGEEEESVDPQELWQSPEVVYEELRDDELEEYENYLWDLHEETDDDDTLREVMSELRDVDSEQLSREGEEKGADPKDEDVREAAEYLAQELAGDVEPGDVVDAVQTHRRVQPDDE